MTERESLCRPETFYFTDDSFGSYFGCIVVIATVVLGGMAHVPPFDAVGCPCSAVGWCFVDNYLGTGGSHGYLIEVECTISVSFGG